MSVSTFFRNLLSPAKGGALNLVDRDPWGPTIQAGNLRISREGYNLILRFEVGGGQAYYEKLLRRPTWPGGESGVTIGVGYDLGYNSKQAILADWHGLLPAGDLSALATAAGVKGSAAKARAKSLSHIIVPWKAAETVFNEQTLRRFGYETVEAFPGATNCHPHVQGALLSLVFNRGPAVTGKNRQDMMDIRRILADGVQNGDYKAIATQLREMKAIWKGRGLDGLLTRREAEAKLVESAI